MKKVPLLLLVAAAFPNFSNAQGCSDAGVCSAGPIGQLQLWTDSVKDVVDYRHMARLGYTYALGEQGTTIMQANAELGIGITSRLSMQLKVPYVWVSGNLGANSGIGDAIGTLSYAFINKRDRDLSLVAGVRYPTGSTSAHVVPEYIDEIQPLMYIERPLPMPYQTGLGTTDLLLGVNARRDRWSIGLAYQHVMDRMESNRFTHASWFGDDRVEGYFESLFLERADDAVARVQYAYGCGRLSLQPGLLGIYHLDEDTRLNDFIVEGDRFPQRAEIDGSQGLTLNVTLDLRFKLSEHWAIEASMGAPVVTREVRPDGLTREFVGTTWVRYRF